MTGGSCGVCQQPALQCCSGCHAIYYCSRDHQKQHWRVHKATCQTKLYHVAKSNTLGRYLIATKDINAGDVIVKEKPLIVGPKVVSLPMCLECNKRVTDRCDVCGECGWPLCGQCVHFPNHAAECRVMKENGYRASISNYNKKEAAYCFITPLRCLLLRDKEPTKWKSLMNLESHLQERRNTPLYKILSNNVVGFVRNVLNLKEFDEETILNICGILDTNTFELRRNTGEVKVRGLYPTAAIMAHDCTPNTKHTFEDDFTMCITATVPIKKGDVISTTYTQTLWDTQTRRAHIRLSKCFDCSCKRCSDSTELGTYLGSLNCTQCTNNNDGEVSKMLSTNPLDSDAVWKCESCGFEVTGEQTMLENGTLRKEVLALDKSTPKAMEEFLVRYKEKLHASNTHVLEIKYALSQLYGNARGFALAELKEGQLKRKIGLCHELLSVASILDPGSSRLKGLLLMDLQDAIVILAAKLKDSEAQKMLQVAMSYLQESIEILNEPEFREKLEAKMLTLKSKLTSK